MLVDDHEVVRDGVKSLLQAAGGMLVVAEAATVREAVANAERSFPDVIVMDVRLADGSGIEATREIRSRRAEHRGTDADVLCRRRSAVRLDHGRRRRVRPQADQGRRPGAGGTRSGPRRESLGPGGDRKRPRAPSQGQAPGRGRSSRGCPRRRSASSPSSPTARPTRRSARRCTSPRRPSRTTCPASSTSWRWRVAPRRPLTSPPTGGSRGPERESPAPLRLMPPDSEGRLISWLARTLSMARIRAACPYALRGHNPIV